LIEINENQSVGEVVKAVSMNYELTPEVQDALQTHI
jgi:hypothetical protein